MDQLLRFVVFILDDQRYSLPLAAVERVVRAAAVTALPDAPEAILGVINVQGQVLPVISLRKRNHLAERKLQLGDLFIIARTSRRTVALVADDVSGVIECRPHEMLPVDQFLPGIETISGVMKSKDGIILVQELDVVLSLSEEQILDSVLQAPDKAGQSGQPGGGPAACE